MSPLKIFWLVAAFLYAVVGGLALVWPSALWTLLIIVPLTLVGIFDMCQKRHAVLRNFPIIGHFRYWMENIRPEIQQYFVESDASGRPFSRELRSVVYQRAKDTTDTRPFGTIQDLDVEGSEWIAHSILPIQSPVEPPRIVIGEGRCSVPYAASVLNISAMSFGALSRNAILALNGGAKLGGFAHNTGEGGISPYHLQPGGDLVWQIGTAYFGCRTPDGDFDPDQFAAKAALDSVKMIEIKLSQGAKPGHGGLLPGAKVTAEIAKIRGVAIGRTVLSPPYHRTFKTPKELLAFIVKLRELSGGKPVGIKLCVGVAREFLSLCKAMVETGEVPDFITVDGAEGGTGAAPLEFTNSIGLPLTQGLLFVHNALVGCRLRDDIRVICSGKLVTGFNLAQRIAIGADLCYSARAMMFALGCIQALRCNTNHCPTGVTTQNPDLVRGLDVPSKADRVCNYHRNTVESFLDILSSAGLSHPEELKPWHIQRCVGHTEVRHYGQVYSYLKEGALLEPAPPPAFAAAWHAASAEAF